MTAEATTRELRFQRVYEAPRELVWRAFTDPAHLTRWWGPRGWSAPLDGITAEVREGGTLEILGVRDADGTTMTTRATFRQVAEPERLVIDEDPDSDGPRGATTTVTFTDLGDGRTQLELLVTVAGGANLEAGLDSALDRLAEHLEAAR